MWLTSFFIGKRERPRVGETRRVSNREIDSPYFSSESGRAPPVDDIVSTIVLPLNMSRMLCGRQIDRSANYFRKKWEAVSAFTGPASFTAGGPNLSHHSLCKTRP